MCPGSSLIGQQVALSTGAHSALPGGEEDSVPGLFVSGWMQYYGAFYRSALHPLLERINSYLVRWIRSKYRRLKPVKKALRAYYGATRAYPVMFRHWRWTPYAWRTG